MSSAAVSSLLLDVAESFELTCIRIKIRYNTIRYIMGR